MKKGNNLKKKNKKNFLKFSPGNLIIILYQLSKIKAPNCNSFWELKFSMSTFTKGNYSKNI